MNKNHNKWLRYNFETNMISELFTNGIVLLLTCHTIPCIVLTFVWTIFMRCSLILFRKL